MQKALSVKTPFTTKNNRSEGTNDMYLNKNYTRTNTVGWDSPDLNPETIKFK